MFFFVLYRSRMTVCLWQSALCRITTTNTR